MRAWLSRSRFDPGTMQASGFVFGHKRLSPGLVQVCVSIIKPKALNKNACLFSPSLRNGEQMCVLVEVLTIRSTKNKLSIFALTPACGGAKCMWSLGDLDGHASSNPTKM